jgi:GGDEF domain-containing protein
MSGPSPDRPGRADPPPAAAAAAASNLVGLVRLIGIAAISIGLLEAAAGIAYREPRAVLLGSTATVYGVWVLIRAGGLDTSDRERTITTIASFTLGLIALAATLQPSMATAMAIASLLPAVVVTPLVSSRTVLRLLAMSGLVGAWSVFVGAALPDSNRLPAELQSALALMTLVLAYTFLILFLWEVSRRLKDTAADLRSVIAMSGDLAQSLDPRLVGDRIAVHIARAVGADDCALSYWDRPANRVMTLGYEPPERRGALNESYAVDDFPATRQVLETQRPARIDVDDPTADDAEVRYLHTIGHRSMAMIPLVAAGRTIGLIEVTAARRRAFGDRTVELATMLAGEAAMALENARLYDEIRHQALHDGLTGSRTASSSATGSSMRSSAAGVRAAPSPSCIDLDDFKVLNDTPRPRPGRQIPRRGCGARAGVLRPVDTAARLGGDEFAVLLGRRDEAMHSPSRQRIGVMRLPSSGPDPDPCRREHRRRDGQRHGRARTTCCGTRTSRV